MNKLLLIFGPYCLCLLMLTACQQDADVEVVRFADASRGFAYGQDGAYGVGLVERTFRVRVDEHNDVRMMVPLDLDGQIADGVFPLVVMVHGGAVPAARYDWLMAHIASRGFIVAAPEYPLDLALFATDNTLAVTNAIRVANDRGGDWLEGKVRPGPGLVLGHSLGGVVAASAWLDSPNNFGSLVLMASEPNPSDDFSGRALGNYRLLNLTGTIDGSIEPERVQEGVKVFRAAGIDVTFGLIDQLNHYQWTQDYTADEIKKDNPPTLDDSIVRYRAVYLIDGVLEELQTGKRFQLLDSPVQWPQGVVTYDAYCQEWSC